MNDAERPDPARAADLPRRLARRLQTPLPGPTAQARYGPYGSYGRQFGPAPANARPAAVLVLLYPIDSAWHIPLTLRPMDLVEHAGQISLPGGTIEPGERSELAAVRELEEELGAGDAPLELLGELSPIYLFRSGFVITPWLACARVRPHWRPNPAEVAELVELPLSVLLDPAATSIRHWSDHGLELEAPSIFFGGHAIWGATAMILGELAAIAHEAGG